MSANANIRAGRAYVEVTAETSKLRANLNAAQSQLRDFGKACQGLGRDMMALGGALSLPFILAERSFAGFDDKMRLVQAVTSSTGEQFDQLTKTAQRLGRETSFTAQQVADAMIGLGRMGFNPSEIVSAIDSVLNLSRATGTDLAESADIAANSLRIFGLEAGKMSQVSDVLTATANGSAQTLTDLFEGLKMAAPQAASCGESIEETCAALGVMANMGIKGSLAGTALRKAFVQFADRKVQAMLREVGVESVDASGNLRKMATVMRDIAVATAKMPTAERLSFMKDVFDVRGMMSGISLTANIDEMDKFLARLKDVSGAADETARAMDRGIGGSFRLFRSAVEGTMNAVGEALTETLKPMTDDVTAVINTFTKWVEANRGLVTSVAATVASVAALGGALFVLGTTSRVLGTGVGVVSKAVSGVSGLFGLLAKKGIVASNAFSLMARAFADYRNASVPALVGTSKLLAALNLPIDRRAKQIAANLVLMSNAETAAVAKSAIAAKFASFEAALKRINVATVTATVSAKLHGIALAKAAVAAKFSGMIAGIRGLTASTVAATVSAKLHGLALARTAMAAKFDGMIASLRNLNLTTVAATISAKMHTAAVGKTAVAAKFGGMLAALKGVNAATASATVSANLHTAAVARTAVAAKFSGIIAAIKGLNRATIAATVSAKAHAAAETLGSLAAKASTAAHTAFAAVSAAVTASHAKAALGAAAAGTANVTLALTTKLVAAGYLAAASAAAAFCAIPITWVLIAVVGALVGLCAYMASATKHTAALSDEMGKLREKGDALRATDQLRMERLQQLADKEKLNNAEMQEAEKLSNQLKSRYGALGITIDKATGSISMATDAQERFNAAMKAQALQQVEAEMAELQKNIRELGEENQSLCGFWVNAWNTITFRMDKAANDITENGKKIDEAMSKLKDARKRRDAILGNEEGSLTGGKTEKEQLEANVEKGRQEKGASREDAERAAKKLADIEKKLTREQRTELENEISDIRELRDEYRELIQTVLSFEKSKKQKDMEKIADLEGRLAEADAVAERRIAAANERAKKKFDKEISDLQGEFDQTAEDIARNRKEGETDRQVDKTLKADPAAGMKLLQNLVNQARAAADQAKADFAKALADASADGKVTDEEKEKIGKAKDAYSYSEGLVDKYAAKLRSAQDETQKRAGSVKPQGAFYARAASALRGNMMEQRMYMATQEIEKHTKKAAELLKDMGGGGQTFQ